VVPCQKIETTNPDQQVQRVAKFTPDPVQQMGSSSGFLGDAFSQAALPVEARKFRDIARCFWAVARPGLANT
jgi:hypothetical protein